MPSPKPTLTLACAANADYAMPLAVMLRSVDLHLAPESRLDVYAVDDGLSAVQRERIERPLSGRVRIHWTAPATLSGALLPTWGQMALTTYQKLALGELLPASADRALWLDCDLVVTADLLQLWRHELDGRLLRACRDRRVPTVSSRFGVAGYRELGRTADDAYFNAGVMLLDVAGWRAEAVGARALDYLGRFRDRVVFWDQEALNVSLAGRWLALDATWNVDPSLEAVLGPSADASTPAEQRERPRILHFSGRLKPWIFGPMSAAHALYFDYLDQTAWSGWRPSRSPLRSLLARYAVSTVRRRLYPLEAPAVALWRAATRRDRSAGSASR